MYLKGVYRDLVSVDGFRHLVKHHGGRDCLDLVAEYFYLRRVQGLPVTAGFLLDDGVDEFLGVVKSFRSALGWSRVFFSAEEFVGFYSVFLDDVSYESVCSVLSVSESSLYRAKRDLLDLHGVGRGLDDVLLRPEGFGFTGEGLKDFACFLVGDVPVGRRSVVWAAAGLLVAGKVI